jgi:hypothetical protein
MATKKSTALAKATAEELLPAEVEFDELLDNLSEMDQIDFPRIRFRQGKFFFSDDPEDKGVDEFEGVIFFYGRQNTYWAGNYDPGNVVPPECFSVDGKEGNKARNSEGQFGSCKTCAFNQFGSGMGKGKACRNQVKLYIQRLGTTVPMTLFLAPTSIGNFMQNYLMNKVTQKGLSYSRVVTNFKAFQKGTETYYRVNFDVSGVYREEEAEKVKKLRDYWMDAIKSDRQRLDASQGGGDDEREQSSTQNVRVVEPRKPAAAAAQTAPADVSDDDDPPF